MARAYENPFQTIQRGIRPWDVNWKKVRPSGGKMQLRYWKRKGLTMSPPQPSDIEKRRLEIRELRQEIADSNNPTKDSLIPTTAFSVVKGSRFKRSPSFGY